MALYSASLSRQEVARFSAQASSWWDPHGPMRSLHEMMPLRREYLFGQLVAHHRLKAVLSEVSDLPLKGMRVLDIGCGGGLMSEMAARYGATVTGLDPSADLIEVARSHAEQSGLAIDYREGTAESLAKEGQTFDLVFAFEILEHVSNRQVFVESLAALMKPQALLFVSTLNKTRRSFLLGVVMAEYVLGWVPAGTHDWERFIAPSDLAALWQAHDITADDLTGLVYKPFLGRFAFEKGRAAVNYFMTGQKG
ncbi:MAG: bifunctional 2-polyprenyl-6-hydroxyphenol methylase/3-demethylubiquinol 3-O-methyltransferase UbiG [Proteobacteria bacterium]|jgi:2-polyprenyl-6-hydroxyphenyl methylase/3-demethylubiquinone-9 3-methyltransferase|nr:bifunctional 2-polyprenyl-6-hydroxyphenol methylase/3-demethylubiquinol 3-O-methyltransferase UbiG [Alphaproteobacteria bacterium]NCC03949.1 bifunctional 2-polyprenyl-6-hydroxyphenol methylase/3-demethylubiquinol 3-O-methyltransferase UbiG [Pseudomonadota bacterium]